MTTMMAEPKTTQRIKLDDMNISTGKKTRLHRMLYEHGPGNGTLLVLPIDQGLEHGPMDFFVNPPCANPNYQYQLAQNGNYSAIALHIGLAEKYHRQYAGKVPLILKINGKTCIPSDGAAFSTLTASVEDAVRLGADAIGYTLYVGSPSQDMDIQQFNEVRQEAERYGMPIVMWAYPRGEFVNQKGGKNSLYAIDYAARVASELGADVVKINYPQTDDTSRAGAPKPYDELIEEQAESVERVVRSAGETMVIFSGGAKVGDNELMSMATTAMERGATGLIFGRNMWQRPMDEALNISEQVVSMMRKY